MTTVLDPCQGSMSGVLPLRVKVWLSGSEVTQPLPRSDEPLAPAKVTVAELRAREGLDPWPPSHVNLRLFIWVVLVSAAALTLAVLIVGSIAAEHYLSPPVVERPADLTGGWR